MEKVKITATNVAQMQKNNPELFEMVKDEIETAPYTEAQLKLVEAKKNAWMGFKFGLLFNMWRILTGETPVKPANGTMNNQSRPKDGTPPQDFILKHMGHSKPLTNPVHKKAYAIIAEHFSNSPNERPNAKSWEDLLPGVDELIEKWCKEEVPEICKHEFKDALRLARMEKKMSQGALATRISYQSISVIRWEAGENISPQAIYEICKVLPEIKVWCKNNPEWMRQHNAVLRF